MAGFSHADNHADALKVARMFHAVHSCSRPVIARVQGDAFGGGVGLAAACDIVVAAEAAQLRAVGSEARHRGRHHLAARGARHGRAPGGALHAHRARNSTRVAGARRSAWCTRSPLTEGLDREVERLAHHLLAASPAALAATKRLLADVVEAPMDDVLLAATAKCIADARVSPEGREGIAAFLEKRAPSWAPEEVARRVRQAADRQPGRNRLPRRAHRAAAGHPHRCGVLRRRRACRACRGLR